MTERYFAAYFDVVRPREPGGSPDDWVERWQYIMMPRHPEQPVHVLFHRNQVTKSHRAVWQAARYASPLSMYDTYAGTVGAGSTRVPRPPVVVELSLEELSLYVAGIKFVTPWKVIERANRAARRAGWAIQ